MQVFGYSAWSLVDGFEWNDGFTIRRGLFYIEFNNPKRTRSPKTTAQYYKRVVADNGFPSDEASREVTGSFPCEFHWGIADSTLQVREDESGFTDKKNNKYMSINSDMFLCCYSRCISTLSHHNLLTPICIAGTLQGTDHCFQSQARQCTQNQLNALTTWPFGIILSCLQQLGHLIIALP